MTSEEEEDESVHGVQGLQGCYKPEDEEILLLSSQYQSTPLHQIADQCGGQILIKNDKSLK